MCRRKKQTYNSALASFTEQDESEREIITDSLQSEQADAGEPAEVCVCVCVCVYVYVCVCVGVYTSEDVRMCVCVIYMCVFVCVVMSMWQYGCRSLK